MNRALGAGLALVCGTLIPTQTRLNGALGVELGDAYLAALVSFLAGLVIIAVIVAVNRRNRTGVAQILGAVRHGEQPWWVLLGGCCGALVVLSQTLTGAVLGAALFTVCTVAGQTASAVVIDRIGLGPSGSIRLSPRRLIGAALTVVAVVIAVSDRLGTASWLALLPLVAGLGLSFQSAVNGRVREIATLPVASLGNFTAGTVLLLIAWLVKLSVVGWPGQLPTTWWLYLSGPIGLAYITINAGVVRYTGVLVLGLSSISGQLLGSLVIDTIVPVAGGGPQLMTVIGGVITLFAVVVTSLRRPAPRSQR